MGCEKYGLGSYGLYGKGGMRLFLKEDALMAYGDGGKGV